MLYANRIMRYIIIKKHQYHVFFMGRIFFLVLYDLIEQKFYQSIINLFKMINSFDFNPFTFLAFIWFWQIFHDHNKQHLNMMSCWKYDCIVSTVILFAYPISWPMVYECGKMCENRFCVEHPFQFYHCKWSRVLV